MELARLAVSRRCSRQVINGFLAAHDRVPLHAQETLAFRCGLTSWQSIPRARQAVTWRKASRLLRNFSPYLLRCAKKMSLRVFAGPGLPKPAPSAPDIDLASITPASMVATWSSWAAAGDEDTAKGIAHCVCLHFPPPRPRRLSTPRQYRLSSGTTWLLSAQHEN